MIKSNLQVFMSSIQSLMLDSTRNSSSAKDEETCNSAHSQRKQHNSNMADIS